MKNRERSFIKVQLQCFVATVFCLLTMMGSPARGQELDKAIAMMTDGNFLKAAEIAATMESSKGFTLAARALAIYGYEIAPENERQELFLRAMGYAYKAIELNANSSEAFLEVSHTLGRYAQTVGVAEALSEGFAERIKAATDKAIEIDPQNYRAHLSVGAWHSEIVAAAGFMAGLLYGANEEDSLVAYQRALILKPNSSTVHFEYAVGLMRLDDKNLNLAREHLQKAISVPVKDAYGQIIREKALQNLAQLQKK